MAGPDIGAGPGADQVKGAGMTGLDQSAQGMPDGPLEVDGGGGVGVATPSCQRGANDLRMIFRDVIQMVRHAAADVVLRIEAQLLQYTQAGLGILDQRGDPLTPGQPRA